MFIDSNRIELFSADDADFYLNNATNIMHHFWLYFAHFKGFPNWANTN